MVFCLKDEEEKFEPFLVKVHNYVISLEMVTTTGPKYTSTFPGIVIRKFRRNHFENIRLTADNPDWSKGAFLECSFPVKDIKRIIKGLKLVYETAEKRGSKGTN